MNHILLPAKLIRKFHDKNIVCPRFNQVVYVVAEIKSTTLINDFVSATTQKHGSTSIVFLPDYKIEKVLFLFIQFNCS